MDIHREVFFPELDLGSNNLKLEELIKKIKSKQVEYTSHGECRVYGSGTQTKTLSSYSKQIKET